jgi:hypothetical protein
VGKVGLGVSPVSFAIVSPDGSAGLEELVCQLLPRDIPQANLSKLISGPTRTFSFCPQVQSSSYFRFSPSAFRFFRQGFGGMGRLASWCSKSRVWRTRVE